MFLINNRVGFKYILKVMLNFNCQIRLKPSNISKNHLNFTFLTSSPKLKSYSTRLYFFRTMTSFFLSSYINPINLPGFDVSSFLLDIKCSNFLAKLFFTKTYFFSLASLFLTFCFLKSMTIYFITPG